MKKLILLFAITFLFNVNLFAQGVDSGILRDIEISHRLWSRVEIDHSGNFIKFGTSFTLNKSSIEVITSENDHIELTLISGRKYSITSRSNSIPLPLVYRILSEVLEEGKRTVLSAPSNEKDTLQDLIERLEGDLSTNENKSMLFKALFIYAKTKHWSDVSVWLEVVALN